MHIINSCRYEIPLEPVAWKAHSGYGSRSFNPRYKEKEAFQWYLRKSHDQEELFTGPLMVEFLFEMPIPKSFSKKKRKLIEDGERIFHTKRKDLTNCIKFTEDCLKGVVIEDDNCICIMKAQKYYSLNPKVIIHLYSMEN